MGGGISGVLIAAVAFGMTFVAVRLAVNLVRKRKAAQARQQVLEGRSRQVRRAAERRKKG
ncbi:MAG TPA: hypothetical protein VLJ57_21405 [Burkholderiaceae bacterium]|nr:hypothetical protein [Burkholderiaceae bacterium]